MAGLRATYDNAVARHMSAVGRLTATRAAVDAAPPIGPDAASLAAENALAQKLTAVAQRLRDDPGLVHIGQARLHESSFPVLVPFINSAHLTLSADTRDPRVAALLRAVLLRAMTSAPPGSIGVEAVDVATVGASLAALQPLVDARLLRTATDSAGLDRALGVAEEHVRAGLRGERSSKMIFVIASVSEINEDTRGRIEALARSGVASGLHLLAAGFGQLPAAVAIRVDDDMWIANPPDTPFGARGGLSAPVAFDRPLTDDYVRAEATRIADRARAAAELRFADLAPDRLWSEDPGDGLTTLAGRDQQGAVRLSFDDETPHWLVGGRTGGGKTVFLLDILYGLAARYSPDDLALYLLDFKEGVSFTEFTPQPSDPTFIPHARAVGVESDREYGVAILRELDAEMTRRSVIMKKHGVARYSQLRGAERLPRILCVVDEFQVLFAGNDKLAKEAVAVLENLARKGRSYGVHMILASQTTSGIEALYTKQESIFGQFPLRIALPGATSVLDPQNPAAQGLRTGEVVVNADGGVAGRDRKVRFPNAHAETEALYQLRHDLW
ncbi:MAG: FtsK/SpoIIIE domain-containing protein, partial [Stackebrandtia sp.]